MRNCAMQSKLSARSGIGVWSVLASFVVGLAWGSAPAAQDPQAADFIIGADCPSCYTKTI
jgi:hypothetical protein